MSYMPTLDQRVGRVMNLIFTVDMITEEYTLDAIVKDQHLFIDTVLDTERFEDLPQKYQDMIVQAEREAAKAG